MLRCLANFMSYIFLWQLYVLVANAVGYLMKKFAATINFAIYLGASNKLELHKHLCEALNPTVVGEALKDIKGEESIDFYKRYLQDFVKLVYKSKRARRKETKEYEVILVIFGKF